MERTTAKGLSGRWIIGGIFIAFGILLLMMNFHLIDRFPIWKFWPLIFIVIGINKFVEPFKRAEGFWMIALGLWMQWSMLRLFGYGWGDTWPVALIALGIYFMWESVERQSRRRHNEQVFSNH